MQLTKMMMLLMILACGIAGTLANYNYGFSLDMFRELVKSFPNENFLVSPLSVEMILSLMKYGARGATANQIGRVLDLANSPAEAAELLRVVEHELQDKHNLSLANKLYLNTVFEITDDFEEIAKQNYSAEIQNIDFGNAESAVAEINKWVAEETHDKIKDLLAPGDVNAATKLVLVNTLFFQGNWKHMFKEYDTRKRTFYYNLMDTAEIDMMETTGLFHYYEDSNLNARFLKMFYEGDDISMTIMLPNDKLGLPGLEKYLVDVYIPYFGEMPKVSVQVTLPKFKIEYSIELKSVLQAMGIKDAFEVYADFTGISASEEHIEISKIKQKTFIEIDEQGTTAAAASVVSGVASANFDPNSLKFFKADHPFIFYIHSIKLDAVLFVGRYRSP